MLYYMILYDMILYYICIVLYHIILYYYMTHEHINIILNITISGQIVVGDTDVLGSTESWLGRQ